MPTVIVDGNNVIGSVPDGWWRDRAAAARRLLARLRCHARSTEDRLVLVLDVPQDDLPEGDHDGVTVLYARRHGRNGADDRIAELAGPDAEVVTSDRELASRSRERGARVSGARNLLDRLAEAGC